MASAIQTANIPEVHVSTSKAALWSGRVISGIVILFSIFDGVTKVIKEPHVVAASADLGYSLNSIVLIGGLLLFCTLLYAIPRTAVLGALLMTGYLGGAVASNIRVGHPLFQCIFPLLFAALAWAGIFVRDARLREMIPLRKYAE